MRAAAMFGPAVHAGVAAERSMISVVSVARIGTSCSNCGPPPRIITRGAKFREGSSGRSTDVPYSRYWPKSVVATFLHVPVAGSYVFAFGFEPDSKTVPFGSSAMRGYNGMPGKPLPECVHVFVDG